MPASSGCDFFFYSGFRERRPGMAFLPACLTFRFLSSVKGIGGFSAFLVRGRRERGVGAVVIDDASLKGIVIFEEPVLFRQTVYFFV